MKTSIHATEDEANFVNLGQLKEKNYMQFDWQPSGTSSWNDYPRQYKYMSIDFDLNMDIMHTDRATYDLLDMLGDVGGVMEILTTGFGLLASPFAILRIKAILTNRLFHLSSRNR